MVQSEEQWQETTRYFARVVDGLGTRIDPKIRDTVVAFNVVGIHTVASCAGHVDHGAPYPWIDVGDPAIEELSQTIARRLHEGERDAPETKQLQHRCRLLYLDVEQQVVTLLNAFYQQYQMDYDRHLSISRYSNRKQLLQIHTRPYPELPPTDTPTPK